MAFLSETAERKQDVVLAGQQLAFYLHVDDGIVARAGGRPAGCRRGHARHRGRLGRGGLRDGRPARARAGGEAGRVPAGGQPGLASFAWRQGGLAAHG
eukprot:660561-Lingulodinium_polyedra.AAC.1